MADWPDLVKMRIAVQHVLDAGSKELWDGLGAGLAGQLALMEAKSLSGETPQIPEGLVYLVDHIDECIQSMLLIVSMNQ